MTTNNSDMEAMAICHFNMSEQKYRFKKKILFDFATLPNIAIFSWWLKRKMS